MKYKKSIYDLVVTLTGFDPKMVKFKGHSRSVFQARFDRAYKAISDHMNNDKSDFEKEVNAWAEANEYPIGDVYAALEAQETYETVEDDEHGKA